MNPTTIEESQKTQHTLGPWQVAQTGRIYSDRGAEVADILTEDRDKWTEEAHANASLIAAAPELLEALKETVFQLRNSSVAWAEPIERAEAAIAKAERRER